MLPLVFLALLQQPVQQSRFQGATTPPSGDTVGYWQQHVHYTIVATLDESQSKLRSHATLVYVNNSPDTLREMFVHQYLNAFRPHSKWSQADQRENRERFQNLPEADIGYERFTQPPSVGGTPVIVDYPGAPDSTVAHFKLPSPLAPHDSVRITFDWDARPSTVTRRQGRRGRTYDFAQWYPKVAVYDRGGWEPNPLIPAGELYGEYGTYDVTMVVKSDQVLASTGVPVSGDPGWARVSLTGAPRLASNAYGRLPAAPDVHVPDGYRAVRFVANDVHHFAWSASPDYRYEGATYVRPVAKRHFPTWDTVSVHVLMKQGDDTTWGGGRALERTIFALRWLESIWGPYAYPAFTNVHRLDPGGTEFPMMIMNGSASQGLILHEAGHVWTYGILGNNEWRSGWLDEGLTDYQTDWALKLTPQEQIGRPPEPPRLPEGYRVNAVTIPPYETRWLGLWQNEIDGRSQPIGLPAYEFHEFGIYNTMIYERAKLMYSQLRDVLGDSAFLAFTHDYYNTWALKHVDERAMRVAAEHAYLHDLNWFFDQWVHHTGLMDYSLESVNITTDGARYTTTVHLHREGELRHAMPVGVHSASGWTIGRVLPQADDDDVKIVTTEKPDRVELDPYHVTWDWDWRNNVQGAYLINVREPRLTFNWPWLDQADRSHSIVAAAPTGWYSNPQGAVAGVRAKSSYLGIVDQYDAGIAFATRRPTSPSGTHPSFLTFANVWARGQDIYFPGATRPLMGAGGGANYLDGLVKLDLYHQWNLSPFVFNPGPLIAAKAYVSFTAPTSPLLLPEQWDKTNVTELGGSAVYKTIVDQDSGYAIARAQVGAGYTSSGTQAAGPSRGYIRAAGSFGLVRPIVGTNSQIRVRIFGGVANDAPRQRAIFASAQDPYETFTNDLFRARGAILKQPNVNYLPLGGAGMRGFAINVPLTGVVAGNGEIVQRLAVAGGSWGRAWLGVAAFADLGVGTSTLIALTDSASHAQGKRSSGLGDAGGSAILRGRFYDRDVHLRLDVPVFVNKSNLAGGKLGRNTAVSLRWWISTGDLW
jgi:hypothetical protein